jgi:hypothetical protein
MLEPGAGGDRRGGRVQLLIGDVGVAADGGEVGVAEIGGHEARVARLLAQPGGGRVAERVGGDALLEAGALAGAADDAGKDRRLQALASVESSRREAIGAPGSSSAIPPKGSKSWAKPARRIRSKSLTDLSSSMAAISSVPFEDGELRIYASSLSDLETVVNVDVEFVDGEGRRWAATFFTLDGLETLFQKNAVTGECARGTYFWATSMIVVRRLSVDVIAETMRDLQTSDEFGGAFELLVDT